MGHYTGTGLASALLTELCKGTVHAGRNTYDVQYSGTMGKIEISLTNDQGLTASTGPVWKVYNGETYVYVEALPRIGRSSAPTSPAGSRRR